VPVSGTREFFLFLKKAILSSVNLRHSTNFYAILPSALELHSAKYTLFFKINFPSASGGTRQNNFFLVFDPSFFCVEMSGFLASDVATCSKPS
jgi:hypothetical protein